MGPAEISEGSRREKLAGIIYIKGQYYALIQCPGCRGILQVGIRESNVAAGTLAAAFRWRCVDCLLPQCVWQFVVGEVAAILPKLAAGCLISL